MNRFGVIAFTLSPVALFTLLRLAPPADAPAAASPCQVVTARHPAGDLEVTAQVCFENARLAANEVGRRVD